MVVEASKRIATEKINLPVLNTVHVPVRDELVEVERTRGDQLRVLRSPGFVGGLAAGDEIELTGDAACRYRIIKRGRNVCVWLICADKDVLSGPPVERARKRVEFVGGRMEGATFHSLTFTISVDIGFGVIQEIFNEAVGALPGASWLYANVFDPKDGETPLNWW